jgi:hypothetical protein
VRRISVCFSWSSGFASAVVVYRNVNTTPEQTCQPLVLLCCCSYINNMANAASPEPLPQSNFDRF